MEIVRSFRGTLLLLACSLPLSASDTFRVGFAELDITPPAGWRTGGYTEFISTGVHDPLLTKAMVLSQGETTLAIVGNDLCSVPRELTARARERAMPRPESRSPTSSSPPRTRTVHPSITGRSAISCMLVRCKKTAARTHAKRSTTRICW